MSSRKTLHGQNIGKETHSGTNTSTGSVRSFFQQYRLFFRYHTPSKVIVFAWVNDEDNKRAYESSEDAYRVFRKMLESGHPPDDWSQLIDEAQGVAVKTKNLIEALKTIASGEQDRLASKGISADSRARLQAVRHGRK